MSKITNDGLTRYSCTCMATVGVLLMEGSCSWSDQSSWWLVSH